MLIRCWGAGRTHQIEEGGAVLPVEAWCGVVLRCLLLFVTEDKWGVAESLDRRETPQE